MGEGARLSVDPHGAPEHESSEPAGERQGWVPACARDIAVVIRFEREGEKRFTRWTGAEDCRVRAALDRLFAESERVGSVERPPLPAPAEPNDDTGVAPAPPGRVVGQARGDDAPRRTRGLRGADVSPVGPVPVRPTPSDRAAGASWLDELQARRLTGDIPKRLSDRLDSLARALHHGSDRALLEHGVSCALVHLLSGSSRTWSFEKA